MNTKPNRSPRALALQSTLRVTLISLSAALLTFAAVPSRNQLQQKPSGAAIALQSAHRRATVSESSAAPKRTNEPKSARIEISASRQRVRGREIAGFSARQAPTAQEEKLTPPAELKPVEQGQAVKIEAPWLIEANGALRADAVRWELDAAKSGSGPQRLRLVVAAGLRYPAMIALGFRKFCSTKDGETDVMDANGWCAVPYDC
jgi:hypothetical protein